MEEGLGSWYWTVGHGDAGTWGCDTQGQRDVGHRNVRTRKHKTRGHGDLAVREAGMHGRHIVHRLHSQRKRESPVATKKHEYNTNQCFRKKKTELLAEG